jgi:hypothetical protein
MTQLTIVTTPTNSGDGTPLATAFNYCNSNFNELYARVQTNPPTTLVGTTGDVPGMYAYDPTYFYYCFAAYDGTSTIWGKLEQGGNISASQLVNGTSNVKIADINGNTTTSINGTPNVVVVATTGQYVTGIISSTGNVRGNYILGNGSQLTGLPATYTNSNVTTLLAALGSNVISSTANITGGNLLTTGQISSAGNVTASNVTTQGIVSATGDIVTTGMFIGTFAGNITGNFVVPGSNTQVIFNTNGNADAAAGMTYNKGSNTFVVLGIVSAQGNVIGGNITTGGQVSATGNITGGNLTATNIAGTLTTASQTNITALGTLSALSVTGNVNGGNLRTAGQVTATGNITGGNVSATNIAAGGNVSATNFTGTTISVTGNVNSGNVNSGSISASGNITGAYILGNGASLTGIVSTYGNSNVATLLSAFGSNTISTTGTVTSGNITGGNILTAGLISAAGNVTGNYLFGNGVSLTGIVSSYSNSNVTTLLAALGSNSISTTGTVTASSTVGGIITGSSASVTGTVTGNSVTGNVISAAGNITGGNLSVSTGTITTGNIVNSNGNGVGNIGSASTYFNTVFAKATSAQYADLAENYTADADYAPGTVVIFGGEKEITVTTQAADERVAGAISTNPAYLMNSGQPGLALALRGKVPVRVVGAVAKGDSLVTSTTPGAAASVGRSRDYAQAVFAKALETDNSNGEKVILAVII